jgi:predicted nucleic acid-binding protein
MPLYLDSDAVVKRYVDERDGATAIMDEIYSDPAPWGGLTSSEWLLPEVTAALSKKYRQGDLKWRQFSTLLADFRAESGALLTFVTPGSGDIEAASRLIGAHARVRFHAGDALHLHTAETLRREIGTGEPLVFVTSDAGLAGVAVQLGLPMFNPLSQTLADLESLFGK